MNEGRVTVRLVARADRNELTAFSDGVLHARVTAPPVDGEANEALCRLIAKRLGVGPSKVKVIQGARSRQKVVAVQGFAKATLEEMLRERSRGVRGRR